MTKHKRYEKYKNSKKVLIQDIPENWDIKKVKYIIRDGKEGLRIGPFGSSLKLEEMNENNPYKVYGQENLISNDFTRGNRFISEEKFKEMCQYELLPNDIVISMMGTIGKCKVIPFNIQTGIMDSHLIKLRTKQDSIEPKFLEYLIGSAHYIKEQMNLMSKGSIMSGLNSSIIKDIILVVPSIIEQNIIIKFLDKKTSEIDEVISNKEKLIELLKEKRQAIITEAVTKGINQDVKMKDSGVELIGEIPQSWEVSKLKYLTKKIIDGTHSTPSYTEDGIPFLRVTDITKAQGGEINLNEIKYISQEEHEELIKRCKPEKGDLLVSKNGTIGVPKVVDWDFEFSIFVSLCLIKMKKELNPYFAMYYFMSKTIEEQIVSGGKKSTITNLHLDKIKEFNIALPSEDEQKEIVEYLKKSIYEYDSVINDINNQINKLKEYRQSLIFEAVTGKIDLRDYEG